MLAMIPWAGDDEKKVADSYFLATQGLIASLSLARQTMAAACLFPSARRTPNSENLGRSANIVGFPRRSRHAGQLCEWGCRFRTTKTLSGHGGLFTRFPLDLGSANSVSAGRVKRLMITRKERLPVDIKHGARSEMARAVELWPDDHGSPDSERM